MRPRLADRTKSEKHHQDYLDKLAVPSLQAVEHIARVQEENEKEIEKKYERVHEGGEGDGKPIEADRRDKAASTIQRNYKGYKLRRELSGLSLHPAARWTEAIKQAQYQRLTTPRKPQASERPDSSGAESPAKQKWKRISKITQHAQGESLIPTAASSSENDHGTVPGKLAHKHRQHVRQKEKEIWKGKMMDLPYFLEMVDLKHRYGSNLRSYHAEWKKTDTNENFFYWLDRGEGKNVEIPSCSRERLEREQVRYLSREERLQYLVVVDNEGKLCWRKNGQPIDTTEDYRDSVQGIVAVGDPIKAYREEELEDLEKASGKQQQKNNPSRPTSSTPPKIDSADTASLSSRSSSASLSSEGSKRYPDPPDIHRTRGLAKLKTVSPHLILNRLMRTTITKNTWIFVADTSMNLYVGIKQSGVFQHSSFLHGSRISAAGLIKIKNGQLRSLSPLSGHYRPPAEAFRHFVHHLKDQGVDMSRVSISKAYAVLVGLEAYSSSKRRVHRAGHRVKVSVERVVAPEKAKERAEREKDPSRSARPEEERVRETEARKGTGLERVLREAKEKVAALDGTDEGEGEGEAMAEVEEGKMEGAGARQLKGSRTGRDEQAEKVAGGRGGS